MDKKTVKKYFKENAAQWVLDAYDNKGYEYPVGFHRARIVLKFISKLNKKNLEIADLGCGGGNLSFMLAGKGHKVIGIDQSEEMNKLAEANLAQLPIKIRNNVKFLCRPIETNGLKDNSFDAVVSMGVIGYFPDDSIIFSTAKKLLKPGGYFLVSCRNRLFNMASISFRTKNEIKNSTALTLIQEIERFDENIPQTESIEFVRKMKKMGSELVVSGKNPLSHSGKERAKLYTSLIEARQHTPKQLNKIANKFGFTNISYFGVHPHLINPRLNKILPPKVFNKISEPLEAFENLPISLSWSSVFIGIFKKK